MGWEQKLFVVHVCLKKVREEAKRYGYRSLKVGKTRLDTEAPLPLCTQGQFQSPAEVPVNQQLF